VFSKGDGPKLANSAVELVIAAGPEIGWASLTVTSIFVDYDAEFKEIYCTISLHVWLA
jgi:hypothetical protein